MKQYILFFLLLIFVSSAPAQPNLLASVEIVEAETERALPVKKKKLKKKKRYKKTFKKNFKKPNKLKAENKINVKRALLFNIIGTTGLAVLCVISAIITGGWNALIFLVAAGLCALISINFLIIFLIYIAVKNRTSDEKTTLKKSEKDLRAEVPYLSEGKIKLYLALNEEVASAKINKDILIRTNRDTSREEWRAAKVKIKELEGKIKHAELQIQELRTQNKIKKVRRERG
ncbi:MAG: Unknown protein [uncultured Aureispira sp.]|uniref:IncA protein n=1 Tax=uncultured Aureispira sp. TaxID=1331704 RepID=A0A6S6TCE0_9BACT|nr:MAG: Unknown protein [uncultured Aureispira sp.]